MKFVQDNTFCAVGFNSRLKLIYLQLYLIFSKIKVYIYKSQFSNEIKIYGWLSKKGKIIIENRGIGEIKGLYYEINVKSIDLAESYYKQYLENLYFVSYLNKSMQTDKFSCYVKKILSYYFYEVLNSLYSVKEFSKYKRIIVCNSLPNRFVLDRFCVENEITFEIYWIRFRFLYFLMPFIFIISNLKKLFFNGINYHDKINLKLYKYSIWGLSQQILRDDYLIDKIHFKKDDIIFYVNSQEKVSNASLQQLKEQGYQVIDLNKCKINIKTSFLSGIDIFLIQPAILSVILFFEKTGYLIEEMLKFYRDSLPHFLFLSNYNAKCHISPSDHGEIGETILMNRLGCKNILYHWSDMTCTKAVSHAFTVHNVYYTWGPIHHDFQKGNYYHDKVEVVGCILLRAYFDAAIKSEKDIKIKTSKKILICDNSFTNVLHLSEDVYLDYLDLTIDMLSEFPDAEFIFKSKNTDEFIVNSFTDDKRRKLYLEKINILLKNDRFVYYGNTIQLESLIATSDMVVSMSMNSPSTIALILGKEGVYYDTTGNSMHPFAQYKNQIIFDNKRMLIDHVKDVLDKKKSAFSFIDPDLLNQYEPYKDSKAIERLISSIHKETNTPLRS